MTIYHIISYYPLKHTLNLTHLNPMHLILYNTNLNYHISYHIRSLHIISPKMTYKFDKTNGEDVLLLWRQFHVKLAPDYS